MFVYCAVFRAWLLDVYRGWFLFGLVALLVMLNEHPLCYGFISIWHCFQKLQFAVSLRPIVVLSGCSLTVCYLCGSEWSSRLSAEVVVGCSSHSDGLSYQTVIMQLYTGLIVSHGSCSINRYSTWWFHSVYVYIESEMWQFIDLICKP